MRRHADEQGDDKTPTSLCQRAGVAGAEAGGLPAADDRTLVELTLQGDLRGFETIMRRHNRRLYRLARAVLRDPTEAEDALQDAYLAAFRGLQQFRQDATLSTWLSRLVLNQCFARLRRESRRNKVVPVQSAGRADEWEQVPDQACGPDVIAMRDQMRALLERKLDELPDEYRLAFVLREIEEMSAGEVATSLGLPEATVRSRAFRARQLLRATLTRDFDLALPDLYEFGGARCDRIVAAVLSDLSRSRPG